MATLSFYGGGGPYAINNLGGSGLGFYGSAFGNSVVVGSYQDTTFVTNSAGTTQGQQVCNIKYYNASSGEINGAAAVHVQQIPNYLATLNIRFEHGSNVKTQNVRLRIYDRDNINNDPSGVTCKVYECVHPGATQVLVPDSGANTWSTPHGSGSILSLVSSPGYSGLRPNGPNTQDVRHDWYVCLSPSPDSIGSKTQFGMYFSCEYL